MENYMIIKNEGTKKIVNYHTDYDNIVSIAQLLTEFNISFYIIDTKNNIIIFSN
jgi:hypothetical protein